MFQRELLRNALSLHRLDAWGLGEARGHVPGAGGSGRRLIQGQTYHHWEMLKLIDWLLAGRRLHEASTQTPERLEIVASVLPSAVEQGLGNERNVFFAFDAVSKPL